MEEGTGPVDKDSAGYVVPELFVKKLEAWVPLPSWMLDPDREPPKPLTWRWRFYFWRMDLRERIHDWLFPDFRRDDW